MPGGQGDLAAGEVPLDAQAPSAATTARQAPPRPHRPAGLERAHRAHPRRCGAVPPRGPRAPETRAAGVDLSAYRIIQEALTDVVRHVGTGASCVVHVGGHGRGPRHPGDRRWRPAQDTPLVSVASVGTGHGIIGMRERVHCAEAPSAPGRWLTAGRGHGDAAAAAGRRARLGRPRTDDVNGTGPAPHGGRRCLRADAGARATAQATAVAAANGTAPGRGLSRGAVVAGDDDPVAVADDQALVRVGFCGIVAATPGSPSRRAANGGRPSRSRGG